MPDLTNAEYFAHRATVARILAETATDPRAAEAHLGMALRYQALAIEFQTRRQAGRSGYAQGVQVPA